MKPEIITEFGGETLSPRGVTYGAINKVDFFQVSLPNPFGMTIEEWETSIFWGEKQSDLYEESISISGLHKQAGAELRPAL